MNPELSKENQHLSQSFRNQAISFLNQAIEIAQIQLRNNSPHIKRLSEKLKKMKNFEDSQKKWNHS